MRPRIIIADDHLLFVEGLWRVIERECDIVATASNGRELVELALHHRPDVVLLDVTMPLLSGIEAARQLRSKSPEIKLIFVTMQASSEYVREAYELGASGYLSKQVSASRLTEAIQQVQAGRFVFPPNLRYLLPDKTACSEQSQNKLFGTLTPRQREILQLVSEGRAAKEIANVLSISVKTVEFHKRQLMSQLELRSSAELIRYAFEQGWTRS